MDFFSEDGQGMVEYTLVIAAVVALVIIAVYFFKGAFINKINETENQIDKL